MTVARDEPASSENNDAPASGEADRELTSAFSRSVDEGSHRLERSLPELLATGTVGGIDVTFGVFALFIVEAATGNRLLSALAFSIGFISLTLARSELFTENFLVPIVAVVAGRQRPASVLRLWVGTAVTNLLAGWVITWLLIVAFPSLEHVARESAAHFADPGITGRSFASALLGGAIITLMTWMQQGAESEMPKLVAAVTAAFVLAAAPLDHVIVATLEMFAGLHAGATFGYGTWALTAAWYALGNVVGGVGLVTMLRLVQVGEGRIRDEQGADRS
jgi:formate/nitrite transporter FocA (FNT family)